MGRIFEKFDDGAWVEVWAPGKYPQGSYTESDLHDIATSYNPENIHEAKVNVDHGDKSKGFAVVAAVKEAAGKLYAKYDKITDSLKYLNRDGMLNGWSIELDKLKDSGKWYLTGISALINKQPQVKGLAPAIFEEGVALAYFFDLDQPNQNKEGSMDLEGLKKWFSEQLTALSDQLKELKAKFTNKAATDEGTVKFEDLSKTFTSSIDKLQADFTAKFTDMSAKIVEGETAKAELAKQKKDSLLGQIKAFCEKLSGDGKFLPAFEKRGMVAFMERLAEADEKQTVKFSDAKGEEKTVGLLDWFQGFMSDFKPIINFAEIVTPKMQGSGMQFAKVQFDEQVTKTMQTEKLNRAAAIAKVMNTQPDLYEKAKTGAAAAK
jgi:hypothetical protein